MENFPSTILSVSNATTSSQDYAAEITHSICSTKKEKKKKERKEFATG